jgi:hypothetical protein
MRNDRTRHGPLAQTLRRLPLLLLCLFAVVAIVDILLVLRPGLVNSLGERFAPALTGSATPSWARLMAASVTLGALALTAALLAGFARGVRSAPYLWLAPTWAASCAFVVAHLQLPLPLPLTTPHYAAFAALLWVGGGALFRADSFAGNCVGAALLATPLVLLSMSYMLVHTGPEAAIYPFDFRARLLTLVVGLASVGTPLIAIAWPRERATTTARHEDDRLSAQMLDLLERARDSEARAMDAERRLRQLETKFARARAADALVAPRPRIASSARPKPRH